jgi:hypothetical protein
VSWITACARRLAVVSAVGGRPPNAWTGPVASGGVLLLAGIAGGLLFALSGVPSALDRLQSD